MAEKKFLVDISLEGNILKKFILDPLASAPTPLGEGHMYYNTTDDKVYIYDGAEWDSTGSVLLSGDVVTTEDGTATIQSLAIATGMVQDDAIDNTKLSNMAANTIKGTIPGGDPTDLNAASVRQIINVEDGAEVNDPTDLTNSTNSTTVTVISSTGGDTILPSATQADAGVMSAADKTTLDNIVSTDATSVSDAGAVMYTDTNLATDGPQAAGWVDTDDTMTADSDTVVPSQQAVKAFVTAQISAAVSGGVSYKGGYNASTDVPDIEATPAAIVTGDMYTVTFAGDFYGTALKVGDVLIAEQNNPTLIGHWTIIEQHYDQDAGEIKSLYESNADTNVFDDAAQTKLANISDATESTTGLARNATDAEILAGTLDDENVFVNPKQLDDAVQAGVGIPVGADNASVWSGTVNAALSSVMNHGLNTSFVQVQVTRTASPYDVVETYFEITDANNVTVTFNTAPSAGEYTVVVVGG